MKRQVIDQWKMEWSGAVPSENCRFEKNSGKMQLFHHRSYKKQPKKLGCVRSTISVPVLSRTEWGGGGGGGLAIGKVSRCNIGNPPCRIVQEEGVAKSANSRR